MADPTGPAALLGLAALLAAVAGAYAWLYRSRRPVAPTRSAMGFLQHLRELGSRVARVLILWGLWAFLFTVFRFAPASWGPVRFASPVLDIFDNAAARVYLALATTSLPEGVQVIVTRPTEAVAAQFQVAFLLGFVLAFPSLIFEAWAFFSPALEPRERRIVARAIPAAGLLFLVGAAFAYLFVVPALFRVLYAFAAPLGATTYLTAGSLVGTLSVFALLFGLAFELPLVMVLLVRLRFATARTYIRAWRHATIAIFVVAALVTDPTLVSQLIVAAILLGLYWGGVLLSVLARPAEPTGAHPSARAA